MESSHFLVVVLFLCSIPKSHSQFPFFSPSALSLSSREWRIPEDEPVGTRIAQVRATADSTRRNITFNLEATNDETANDTVRFFRIDPHRGSIYLKEPLHGKKGEQFSLYVTGSATDEEGPPSPSIKVEVWVQILAPGNINSHHLPPISPPKVYPPPGSVVPTPPGGLFDPNNGLFGNGNSLDTESSGNANDEDDLLKLPSTHMPPTVVSTPYPPKYNVVDETVGNESDDKNVSLVNNNLSGEKPVAANGDTEEDSSNSNGPLALVTILPALLIIISILGATLYLVNRKKKAKKRHTKEMRKESAITTSSNGTMSGEGDSPSALTQWVGKRAQSNRYESWNPDQAVPPQTANRWEFPRHHLKISEILGEGCFGQVWKSEALNIDGKDGLTTVAVKTLKESAGERERSDLLSELAVMKMLDPHPNVVRLLGACTEKDPIFVVMEYVALGKLQSYLRKSRAYHYYGNLHGDSDSLSSKDLTSFAHQVARGMEYLASKGIIHRDLAARNILIDKDRTCKVADFGFARDVVDNHIYERKSDGRLPIRWMAPEALYDNIFTTKTDVWSFGVLMWEIVTLGSTPYPGMAAGEVMRKVRDGYRLEKPEHCRRELYNIMFYCWANNSADRPSFSELVNFLRHLLFSETDYIELDRFPDHDYYNMSSLSGEKL